MMSSENAVMSQRWGWSLYLQLLVHHPRHFTRHRLQFVLNGSDAGAAGASGAAALQVVEVREELWGGGQRGG